MRLTPSIRATLCGLALAGWSTAAPAVTTETTIHAPPTVLYGISDFGVRTLLTGTGTVRYLQDCANIPGRLQTGDISASVDGVTLGPPYVFQFTTGSCSEGVMTQPFFIATGNVYFDMGQHTLQAQFLGRADLGLAPSIAQPAVVTVVPEYVREVPGGLGSVGVGFRDIPGQYRAQGSTAVTLSAAPAPGAPPTPADLRFPYGFVSFSARHVHDCYDFPECPPVGEKRAEVIMQIQMPAPLPAGASIWAFLPYAGAASPGWQPLAARIDGRLVTVRLSGGYIGSATQVVDAVLRGSIGVAIPQTIAAEQDLQDMWWGGPMEDGWGVSIQQRGEALFATVQVYDGDGSPMWLMMPDGSWDPARTSFSGHLYRPGSPRTLGAAVGDATLTFADPGNATLSYSIHGARGSKALRRMPFPPAAGPAVSRAGVWDLLETGSGGLMINQRGATIFASWLTFGANGPGGWLVLPGGAWIDADTFEGALYRTTGSPWVGTTYESSKLRVTRAGQARLRFTGPGTAELSYTVDGVSGTSQLARHPF